MSCAPAKRYGRGVLGFRQNKLGQLALDLFALLGGELEPEVATVLGNAFSELDGRELTDLYRR